MELTDNEEIPIFNKQAFIERLEQKVMDLIFERNKINTNTTENLDRRKILAGRIEAYNEIINILK